MESLSPIAERSVYLPEIDAEHVQIQIALDEISIAAAAGASLQKMECLLRRLDKEVVGHFAHEERLMRASHYPEFAWHKRQHATALRKVEELVSQFRQGDLGLISPGLESIGAWLSCHISVADSMASAHIRNHAREFGVRGKARTSRKVSRPQ
jgi:hemerythrin